MSVPRVEWSDRYSLIVTHANQRLREGERNTFDSRNITSRRALSDTRQEATNVLLQPLVAAEIVRLARV